MLMLAVVKFANLNLYAVSVLYILYVIYLGKFNSTWGFGRIVSRCA